MLEWFVKLVVRDRCGGGIDERLRAELHGWGDCAALFFFVLFNNAMQTLTLAELDTHDFDAVVLQTPDIDHFCSASPWILPAQAHLMPPATPWLRRSEAGYVAMTLGTHPEGWTYLQPLEAAWCFACPLLGPSAKPLVREFAAESFEAADVLVIGGLAPGSELFRALAAQFSRHRLAIGQITHRCQVDLQSGAEAFLGRRSANFRRTLQRAERRTEALTFEFSTQADAFARTLDLESRSWKGRAHTGLTAPEMALFYGHVTRRLAAEGGLRLLFARHHDRDVGYLLGGVFGGGYRALQFSFDEAYKGYSLGHLMQWKQIQRLCEEGIGSYDLGMEIPYKRRWADVTQDTVTLVISS